MLDALRLFAEKGIGAALVMEGERLLGVFTERDYARKLALPGESAKDVKVREVMSTDALCVGPERTTNGAWR